MQRYLLQEAQEWQIWPLPIPIPIPIPKLTPSDNHADAAVAVVFAINLIATQEATVWTTSSFGLKKTPFEPKMPFLTVFTPKRAIPRWLPPSAQMRPSALVAPVAAAA